MNALAYILYNKKLKDRHLKLKSLANEEDSLLIDELPSDDEWLVGENGEDDPHLSVDDFDVDVFEGEPSQATQPIASLSKNASASARISLSTRTDSGVEVNPFGKRAEALKEWAKANSLVIERLIVEKAHNNVVSEMTSPLDQQISPILDLKKSFDLVSH
nr:HAT, C-terminal dimerization domain containing protein [Ipomoea batatas]